MNPFASLESQIDQIRQQDSAGLGEIRNLLLEIEEFIDFDDYQTLAPDQRLRLQDARKELIAKIEQQTEPAQENGQSISDAPILAGIA